MLAMRRLGVQQARVVKGAKWVDDDGSVDVALLGADDSVLALLVFKEHCFDVEAADRQLGPGDKHEQQLLVAGERRYEVLPSTPRFVVTAVPPQKPGFCFPSGMRRTLGRIFEPANTPEIVAAEKARAYSELCGQYGRRLAPLEWVKRFGDSRCLVIG